MHVVACIRISSLYKPEWDSTFSVGDMITKDLLFLKAKIKCMYPYHCFKPATCVRFFLAFISLQKEAGARFQGIIGQGPLSFWDEFFLISQTRDQRQTFFSISGGNSAQLVLRPFELCFPSTSPLLSTLIMGFWVEHMGAKIGRGMLLLFQVEYLIQEYHTWIQILDTFILGI